MCGKAVVEPIGSSIDERRLLLVVSPDLPSSIVAALRAAEVRVFEVESARDALASAAEQPIGLLAAPERLSDMSAAELARSLFEQYEIYSVLIGDTSEPDETSNPRGVVARVHRSTPAAHCVTTIRALLSLAHEVKSARAREQRLRNALAAERDINTAIGVLMERLRVTRSNAFERLRSYARSQRRRVLDVSRAVLGGAEESNRIVAALRDIEVAARQDAVLDE